MYRNPFLRSLLEAPGDNNQRNNQNDEGDPNAEEDQQNQNPDDADQNTEDQNQDQNDDQEDNDQNQDDQNNEDDPFADDNPDGEDGEEENLDNPPDGLESPDATGDDTGTEEGEADEQNIQLNILSLSKLDRLTLKQKCFANFKDLRVKITRVLTLVDDNEQLLDPKFRDETVQNLSELSNAVNMYMTTKFSYNNYEENAKNFNIFASQLDEIIKTVYKTTQNKNK